MSVCKATINIYRQSIHSCSKLLQQTSVKLTKDVYAVKRGNYAVLNETHIRQFEKILGKSRVVTDADELDSFNTDWLKMVRGDIYIYETWLFVNIC